MVLHVPEAAAITNPFGPVEDITLRRLYAHQRHAGRASDRGSGVRAVRLDRRPRPRPAEGQHRDPADTQTKYCNIAFQLLGAVVERISGQAFAAYVSEHLLVPLGLTRTAFDAEPGERAVGYFGRSYSDHLPPANVHPSGLFEADGGLVVRRRPRPLERLLAG